LKKPFHRFRAEFAGKQTEQFFSLVVLEEPFDVFA